MMIKSFGPLLIFFVAVVSSYADGQSDCNHSITSKTIKCYNGVCTNGTCICHQGWTGHSCSKCNGRVLLEDDFGYITDGVGHYDKARECSWILLPKRKGDYKIRLRLNDFATECGWDYVYIYDGDSALSPLLGSFNGLIPVSNQPEVVATSGAVFVHFFSDAEYTMEGFNISFIVNGCPLNCSGNGKCDENTAICQCDPDWTGDACESKLCSSACSSDDKYCYDADENSLSVCDCSRPGSNCSTSSDKGSWMHIDYINSSSIVGRSSHSGVLYKDSIWFYGGIQFGKPPFNNNFHVYNITSDTWDEIPNDNVSPKWRYGHSMTLDGSAIYLFGGRDIRTSASYDELWVYDISSKLWSQISYYINDTKIQSNSSVLSLWGHTGTLVELSDGRKVILVMFGFNTHLEYSGFVFEYDMESKIWNKLLTHGADIEGGFGHTTTWDSKSKLCYIHGGFVKLSSGAYGISNLLYSYQPDTKFFKALRPSGVPRYLHSSVIFDDILLVYGGCTHNDTQRSTGALCFSPSFIAYHVTCNTWETLQTSSLSDSAIYGHVAVFYQRLNNQNGAMIIHGGYNGEISHNTFQYQIHSCESYLDASSCNSNSSFIMCAWNGTHCFSTDVAESSICSVSSQQSYCSDFPSCPMCTSTGLCKWCDGKCDDKNSSCFPVQTCLADDDIYCLRFRNCRQCEYNPECQWKDRQCRVRTDNSSASCEDGCGMHSSCDVCLQKSCMWCTNKKLCVSTSSYVIQFPYGECMEWINKGETCPNDNICSHHTTCSSCLADPYCGWCDDGSNTGLGSCKIGELNGVSVRNTTENVLSYGIAEYKNSSSACSEDSWYFYNCPICQCNGHSTCINGTSTCIACEDQTTGKQCEKCMTGYFGNAENGGVCQPCECYGRAELCDADTGKCLCTTKGVIGDKCEKCDGTSKYFGDPTNGTCFYRLLINFSYTFNLNNDNDKHVTAINFEATPENTFDASITFNPDQPCDVTVSVVYMKRKFDGNPDASPEYEEQEDVVIVREGVADFHYQISGNSYKIGQPNANATIRIYASNFTVPIKLEVSVVQKDNYLLMLLLILFSSFLVLLLLFAFFWKAKLAFDGWRRRRQQAVQLQQMAARPFTSIFLSFDPSNVEEPDSSTKLIKEKVEVAAEEADESGRFAVTTVALWMPSCGQYSQSPSFAMGSGLLVNQRQGHIATKTTDQKPKQKKFKIQFKKNSGSRNNFTTRSDPQPVANARSRQNSSVRNSVHRASMSNRESRRREGPCVRSFPLTRPKHTERDSNQNQNSSDNHTVDDSHI